ncbi:MAG: glycosyltransferase [Ginsengibacter sp.]
MDTILSDIEVSVLMPAYNRESYIESSIKSILDQTFKNFELLVLDDGSTDGTIETILSFNDPRIRLIRNEKNQGIAFSRNRLFEEARGLYYVLLDSDDIAMPNRIELQMKFLKENKDTLLVGTPCIAIDQNGDYIKSTWAFLQKRPTDPMEIKATLLFRNCFYQSSIMINAQLLRDEKYDLEFPPFEDFEFWARLALTHNLVNMETPLIEYRFHPQNISHTTNEPFKFQLNNTIISREFIHYFNYQPTEQELFVHGVWQFYSYKVGYDFLKESSAWLKKLMKLNASKSRFSDKTFLTVLKRNWFDRCWHHLNKGNAFTACYFLFYSPRISLNDMRLFLYLAIKGVYMGVTGKK